MRECSVIEDKQLQHRRRNTQVWALVLPAANSEMQLSFSDSQVPHTSHWLITCSYIAVESENSHHNPCTFLFRWHLGALVGCAVIHCKRKLGRPMWQWSHGLIKEECRHQVGSIVRTLAKWFSHLSFEDPEWNVGRKRRAYVLLWSPRRERGADINNVLKGYRVREVAQRTHSHRGTQSRLELSSPLHRALFTTPPCC